LFGSIYTIQHSQIKFGNEEIKTRKKIYPQTLEGKVIAIVAIVPAKIGLRTFFVPFLMAVCKSSD